MFNHPQAVFSDEMLRPELQDLEIFVDGMDNAELSQIFECSRSRMAVLVRRAVRALRSVLASQAD